MIKEKRFEELQAIGYNNLNVKKKYEYNQLAAALYTTEGGRFAEHTGKAPVWIDNRDPSRSRSHNIKVWGSGEIGEIMLDFEWNEMKEKQGWAEVALPMWDKKLWNGSGAPTLRTVTSVAADVAGAVLTATGVGAAAGAAVAFSDDLLFAGLDYGLGYKSSWEVGNELGKSAAMSALSNFGTAGISSLSQSAKISTTLGKVAVSTGGSAAMTVGTTAIQNFDFNGDFNTSSFLNSMSSAQTWGSAASAALTSTLNTKYVSGMSAESSKFYGGLVNMGVSFAGQGAQYGMYALDALANGNGLYTAYNNMGGLSLNVADLGAMMDMAGTIGARNNGTGQSGLGQLAQMFKGQGIYELNIGTSGITGKLGTGGVNIAGNLYDFAKRMSDKAALNSYMAANDYAKGQAAYNAYVYGDWTQENTAARIASGKDTLEFVSGEGRGETFKAQTTQKGKGRLIEMKDSGNKYENAVLLGHEAYRDGIVSDKATQTQETIDAVIGHAGMASRMRDEAIVFDGLLGKEVEAYRNGNIAGLLLDALVNYKSDGDYWKLMDDGSLAYDGRANLYDENGNLIFKTKSPFIEGSFIEILYGEDATAEQKEAAIALLGKNFSHYVKGEDKNNTDNWYWDTDKNIGKAVSVDQYEDIYKTRIIKDSTTGVEATIEQHNPVNIYNKMVADGVMDVKEEYKGVLGWFKSIGKGSDKYISYEEFKANNYITGGMPQEGKDYQTGDPLNVKDGNYKLVTTKFLAKGNLGTHYGIDLSASENTSVYALLFNRNSDVQFFEESNSAGGNYSILETNLTYTFKGQNFDDPILQRYMHLNSNAENFSGNFANSSFALSGNTGTMTTAAHLHIDLSSAKTSPWLNYMSKTTGYGTYYNNNDRRTYYAPEMFLKNYQWKNNDANTYNK